jgi:hypothetical protein
MAIAEWQEWCKADDLVVDGSSVEVTVGRSRKHRITIEDCGEALRLLGVVVGSRRSGMDGLEVDVWQRNRRQMLVGMRFDKQDRLVGESWVPKVGLTRVEFLVYLRALAKECDRLEFQLTGEDRL